MGLRAANQVKIITASGGGTLAAGPAQSLLVKDIFCVPSSSDTYLTLLTRGTTIGKLRVKGLAGNHLPFPHVKTAQIYERYSGTILALLRAAGLAQLGLPARPMQADLDLFLKNPLDIRFPIASGESLTVSRYAEAGNVVLLYDEYDAGDIKPDLPNGSASLLQRYLHYVTNVATAATGDCAVTTSLIWTGGPSWPVDLAAVAKNNAYRLLAIVGNPLAKGASAASKGYTTFLKLMRENTVLFDADRNGLPFRGDSSALSAVGYVSEGSVIGPGTAENPRPPFVLDPALVFGEGETLSTWITIAAYASGGPAAGELDLAYVLEHEYKTA